MGTDDKFPKRDPKEGPFRHAQDPSVTNVIGSAGEQVPNSKTGPATKSTDAPAPEEKKKEAPQAFLQTGLQSKRPFWDPMQMWMTAGAAWTWPWMWWSTAWM